MSDVMPNGPGKRKYAGVERDPDALQKDDLDRLVDAISSGDGLIKSFSQLHQSLDGFDSGLKLQLASLKDLAEQMSSQSKGTEEFNKSFRQYTDIAKDFTRQLSRNEKFAQLELKIEKKNRDFDRKQRKEREAFEKDNAVVQELRAREDKKNAPKGKVKQLGRHTKEAWQRTGDRFTEATLGKIPGLGGIISGAILDARREKREAAEEKRRKASDEKEDRIRDKLEETLEDMRAELAQRQRFDKEDHEERYGDRKVSSRNYNFDDPFESGPAFAPLRNVTPPVETDADVFEALAEDDKNPPLTIRPRPGQVLRENSAPLGLVMLHNDLEELMKGGGLGIKKSTDQAGGIDVGGSIIEGGIEAIISKLLSGPMLKTLLGSVMGVLLPMIGIAGGMVALGLLFTELGKENVKNKEESIGNISSDIQTRYAKDLSLNLKGMDPKKQKEILAQIQAKLDADYYGTVQAEISKDGKILINPKKTLSAENAFVAQAVDKTKTMSERANAVASSGIETGGVSITGTENARAMIKVQQESIESQRASPFSGGFYDPKTKSMSPNAQSFYWKAGGDGFTWSPDGKTFDKSGMKLSSDQKSALVRRALDNEASKNALYGLGMRSNAKIDINNLNPSSSDAELAKYFDIAVKFKDPPRFHQGGIADHEQLAILRRDEHVLNPIESKVYERDRIQDMVSPSADSYDSGSNDIVDAIERLIVVLEEKNFTPKITIPGGATTPEAAAVNFELMRT